MNAFNVVLKKKRSEMELLYMVYGLWKQIY